MSIERVLIFYYWFWISGIADTILSINRDQIIRDEPPPPKGKADCGRWNVREDRILLNPSYCIGLVQPTLSRARLQLDCSEIRIGMLRMIRHWNVAKF
ncbi:hypothetical protein AVEN_39978-1 [Araneus ventricosus]|uniref:Uncharacterized protein n=1 Tax=Araneus ventricosus TaxID=182803 RepID=A0A4Y2X6Q0_ARAVE|nr:hypothetical protein AVEN_39978-1 [Araneus ventricosus]